MPAPRQYVVGLPVIVTIHDDGTVAYDVDTAETSVSLGEDETAVENYSERQIARDAEIADQDHRRRFARRES
ncbi:hypothetical protein [Nocardioides jejuensis]|uniref:Uncharacterized protein n=1 Tax=Nocardioides jejuensis TaxID=2502782 RepID=A0A4R1BUQ7_9ACTN|nr:hypothetical protein [Nocardioides jejuensis]TCJ21663.1 hypothetical protein EPD65_14645 [Nocardioides jejuensis]